MNLYERRFFGKVNIKDPSKTRTQIGHTNDASRTHANIVPNYRKIQPGDFPEVDKLRRSPKGELDISQQTAQSILKKYNLKDFVPGKLPLKHLGNSEIKIGYNLQRKTFFLQK